MVCLSRTMNPSSDDESFAAMSEAGGTGKYVTELNPHDVLLGRGTGPNNNEGNIKFRDVVEDLKTAYVSTASRKTKNRIVRKTVEAVRAKNGRFLNKLRKNEIKMLGLRHKVVYEIATDAVAVEKTKQALRYVCYKKDAPTRSAAERKKPPKPVPSDRGPEIAKKPAKIALKVDTKAYDNKNSNNYTKKKLGDSASCTTASPSTTTQFGCFKATTVREASPLLGPTMASIGAVMNPPSLLSQLNPPATSLFSGSLLAAASRRNTLDAQLLRSTQERIQQRELFELLQQHQPTVGEPAGSLFRPSQQLLTAAGSSRSDQLLLAAAAASVLGERPAVPPTNFSSRSASLHNSRNHNRTESLLASMEADQQLLRLLSMRRRS